MFDPVTPLQDKANCEVIILLTRARVTSSDDLWLQSNTTAVRYIRHMELTTLLIYIRRILACSHIPASFSFMHIWGNVVLA